MLAGAPEKSHAAAHVLDVARVRVVHRAGPKPPSASATASGCKWPECQYLPSDSPPADSFAISASGPCARAHRTGTGKEGLRRQYGGRAVPPGSAAGKGLGGARAMKRLLQTTKGRLPARCSASLR
jgi:hypothetical protein